MEQKDRIIYVPMTDKEYEKFKTINDKKSVVDLSRDLMLAIDSDANGTVGKNDLMIPGHITPAKATIGKVQTRDYNITLGIEVFTD